MSRLAVLVSLVLATLPAAAASAQPRTNVAVFNFQMKSETPDWRWLEKGLADRMITDLFREPSLTVVQRDAMQQVAEEMRWAPEMMTDPERLDMIRQAVRPRYLVSGVYEVSGGRLSMTASIIDFETNAEAARREVSGPPAEALELARKLSTEVLSWLTRRPAAEVLAELPVWTRSLPAAKAMYEGVDLYDQGRYAEGWLRFRQASREDAAYLEARYWVGKMYYFMDRYEHARAVFESFLYRGPSHPRTADAVTEFLHTYEKLNTPPETLIRLYADLEGRFDATLGGPWPLPATIGHGLRAKRARVVGHLGRFDEAARIMGTYHQAPAPRESPGRPGDPKPYMIAHHMLSGYMYSPEEFKDYLGLVPDWADIIRFDEEHLEVSCPAGGGVRQRMDEWFYGGRSGMILLAPNGRVFRTLRIFPETGSKNEGQIHFKLSRAGGEGDVIVGIAGDVAEGRTKGILVFAIPRCGWLELGMRYKTKRPLEGIRIVAELEDVGPHGTLDIACPNTPEFVVAVDGKPGRRGPGQIGLVPPGRHAVEYRPPSGVTDCYEPWQTTVEVIEGKTTPIAGVLPWKKDGPFASWNPGALVGRDYAVPPVQPSPVDPPSLYADEEGIRLVWSCFGDLWSSVSTDGRTFSPPRRLELPVSSGWRESRPRLTRDESRRFVLLFRGDRDERHRDLGYVCWSRDFEHWSAPAVVGDDPILSGLVKYDGRGRAIATRGSPLAWELALCRDFELWEPKDLPRESRTDVNKPVISVLRREDGRYELYALTFHGGASLGQARLGKLWQYTSADCLTWSGPRKVGEAVGSERRLGLCPVRAEGRSVVAAFYVYADVNAQTGLRMFRETAEGGWEQSPWFDYVAHPLCDVAWHRRWGYIVAWIVPGPQGVPRGPYIISGSSAEALFRAKGTRAVIEREAGDRYDLGRYWELHGDAAKAREQYALAVEAAPDCEWGQMAGRRLDEIGR